jgi:hypothetical protein
MRKSFTAIVLAATLIAAVPSSAGTRSTDKVAMRERNLPTITRVIRMIKRAFGVSTQADPMVPIPAPTPDPGQN